MGFFSKKRGNGVSKPQGYLSDHGLNEQGLKASAKEKTRMDQEKENREGLVKKTLDEEHFASGMPVEQPSLSDKIDSHRAGNLFKYAVIGNRPSEERKSFLAKLRSYKPMSQISNITLDNIPPVRLVGEIVSFDLRQVLSEEILRNKEDYLLIDSILVHFIPLDSFANDKSVVNVQINDFRKVSNTMVRSSKIDNTMGYNLLFFLDYCIEKRDVGRLSLSFSCTTKDFQPDIAWGAVKIIAQVQTRSFPVRLPLLGTMGVILLSDTDLDDFEYDPRTVDLVITPNALSSLRSLKKRGDVENTTLPSTDAKEMQTAKTIIGGSIGEEDVGSVMEKMKEIAVLKERQKQALDKNRSKLREIHLAEKIGDKSREGSLERNRNILKNPLQSHVEDETPVDELEPDDSFSHVGDSLSDVEQAYNSAKPGVKFSIVD